MKLGNFILTVVMLLFVLTGFSSSLAQEKKIEKKDVPDAVISAFQKSYPHAEIKGTSIEKEKGKTYYEIESIEGTQHRDILYTKDGKVAEIEEALTIDQIPAEVKDALKKKYPNGDINKTEKVASNDKVKYELVVKNGTQKYEVVLDSKGNIQKIENMKKENEEKEGIENEKD